MATPDTKPEESSKIGGTVECRERATRELDYTSASVKAFDGSSSAVHFTVKQVLDDKTGPPARHTFDADHRGGNESMGPALLVAGVTHNGIGPTLVYFSAEGWERFKREGDAAIAAFRKKWPT